MNVTAITEWKVFYDGAIVAFEVAGVNVGTGGALQLPGEVGVEGVHLYDASSAEVPFTARHRKFVSVKDGDRALSGELDPVDNTMVFVHEEPARWLRLSRDAIVTVERSELEIVPLTLGQPVARGVYFEPAISWEAVVTVDVPGLQEAECTATTAAHAVLRVNIPRAERRAPDTLILVAAARGRRAIIFNESSALRALSAPTGGSPDTSVAELSYRPDANQFDPWRRALPDVARMTLWLSTDRVALFVGITVDAGAQLMARFTTQAPAGLSMPPGATERVTVAGRELGGGARLRRDARARVALPRYVIFGNYQHDTLVVRHLVRLFTPRNERFGLEYDISVDPACPYEVRLISGENWANMFAAMDDAWFGRVITPPGETASLREAKVEAQ